MKGFVHTLQLVAVEAVPILIKFVQEACSSSSEGLDDDNISANSTKKTYVIYDKSYKKSWFNISG